MFDRVHTTKKPFNVFELFDRLTSVVAVLAMGIWIGGKIALGACAAPFVFRLIPEPFSGTAMGSAFARFDRIVFACAAAILISEMVKHRVAKSLGLNFWDHFRRGLGVVLTLFAVYGAMVLTPKINDLHQAGVEMGKDPSGLEMASAHQTAKTIASIEAILGLVLIWLHFSSLKNFHLEKGAKETEKNSLEPEIKLEQLQDG